MAKPSSGAKVNDRISALPDALVCHILAFLPTVDAVRTTVLSTRWNRKWTLVPNLDFNKHNKSNREFSWQSCDHFMTFVDRVLLFRGSSEIQKLCLECSSRSMIDFAEIDFARVDSWICTAVLRNVVELDLCFDMGFRQQRTFELPQILFTCKTLKVLRLLSNFITNPPPTTGCFPSLKVLYVRVDVPEHDNTPLQNLFSNCPLLEELTLVGFLRSGTHVDINISAPQLKMLKIELGLVFMEGDDQYHFCINAPKLENFDLSMHDFLAFSFEINANSHFKANIVLDLFEDQHDHRIALLEAISNIKHLSLSILTLALPQGVLPAFDNLNHLELATCDFNWGNLIEFLKKSPNLENLVIKPLTGRYCLKEDKLQHDDFNPLEFVPACVLSHLKTITIRGFKGRKDEVRMAKYLLKHGKVLNRMTIFTVSRACARLPYAKEKAFYKDFVMSERGSKTCQVDIFD